MKQKTGIKLAIEPSVDWILLLAVSAIVIVSYSFYSSVNYPLLNSDDGMNILMAHYYDLPGDLYCWGQDRLGSIVPMIAQVYMKIFGASAITGVSLSNYTLLVIGYLGFSSLLKSRFSKMMFALVWFMPYERFIDITRFIIGVEYSLIAIAIYFIRKLRFENASFGNLRNHALLALITFILGVAVWASDLAAVSIAVLLAVLYWFYCFKARRFIPRTEVLLYVFGGAVFWTIFIIKAKTYAVVKTKEFASLNSIPEIFDGLGIMFRSVGEVMIFTKGDIFTGLFTWLLIFLFVFVVYLVAKKKLHLSSEMKPWMTFLLADVVVILGVILVSHWVLINGMGRRYFVATYISLSVALLMIIEHLVLTGKTKRIVTGLLVATVISGAISPLYNMKFVSVKTLRPTSDLVGEFRQLGKIGIIAEYWNAYRTSSPHLDLIKATPHDKSDVRNPRLVAEVFAQPNLYVIRDMWMDSFPDTLQQFGFTLVKDGDEFYMGGCFACHYRRLSLSHSYMIDELKTDPAYIVQTKDKKAIRVSENSGAKGKHIVYGPNCALLPGKYKLRYHLKVLNPSSAGKFAIIDVSGESGQQPLLMQDLFTEDFISGEYKYAEAELNIKERVSNVEFRLIYSGGAEVELDGIELIEE